MDQQGLREAIGFPAAKDCKLGTNLADRVYFFNRGIVTVRDGVAEPGCRRALPPWPAAA
jgi:hypothetical protein